MRKCKTCGKELPDDYAPHCNLKCFENRGRARTLGRYLLSEEFRKERKSLRGKK